MYNIYRDNKIIALSGARSSHCELCKFSKHTVLFFRMYLKKNILKKEKEKDGYLQFYLLFVLILKRQWRKLLAESFRAVVPKLSAVVVLFLHSTLSQCHFTQELHEILAHQDGSTRTASRKRLPGASHSAPVSFPDAPTYSLGTADLSQTRYYLR